MSLHAGQFKVSLDLLAEMLHLPEGAAIAAITSEKSIGVFDRSAIVVVLSDDLPEWQEGAQPVELNPAWDTYDDVTTFNNWGIE